MKKKDVPIVLVPLSKDIQQQQVFRLRDFFPLSPSAITRHKE